MPLYEYYCEKCDRVFEALGSIRQSDEPAVCPECGSGADRIMPTTFAAMSHTGGWARRAPFHHHPVRGAEAKTGIARVKKIEGSKPKTASQRKKKARGGRG